MKAYILTLAGVAVLAAVVACIAPSGKMGSVVKGMSKLVMLVVLVTPALDFFRGGLPDFGEAEGYEEDTAYYLACAGRLETEDESAVAAFIRREFSLDAEAEVARMEEPPFSRKKITIRVDAAGIIGEDERIHILTRIKEEVEAAFGCGAEVT